MSATVLQFRRPKPRTEAEIYVAKQRESMTMRLLREQLEDRVTRDWLREFVSEMENEQRWGTVMLNIEERI
jgi:hypothetical protein